MGEGPIAHPHQPPDSGTQGPGARPKALSCILPHLSWFSVGVRRLEEARATGLACRGAHSRLLTQSSLRSSGGRGFEVGRRGRLVGRLTFQCSCSILVGQLRDGRLTVLFPDMVAGGRGASGRCQPDGRRSCFDPCMPGWFDVGRLACGLFTVKWRLQLRCGRCMVVLATSWSARSAWVSLRCCRQSYCRMLFVRPTRPCWRWPVASWLV